MDTSASGALASDLSLQRGPTNLFFGQTLNKRRRVMTDIDREKRLNVIMQRIMDIPALPVIVTRMMALVDDPDTSAAELTRLISTDQALAVKLLKLANSSYYGFPRQISTINLAIVVLGFDAVKHLGLSVSVLERFKKASNQDLFDISAFWEHSIGCGIACGILAQEFRYRISGEVFVAGLLHDIGKIVLNLYFKDELKQVLQLIQSEGCSFVEAEERLFGITHSDIGRCLAEKWNLPVQLVESIAYHHYPEKAEAAPETVALVHLGDILSRTASVGNSGDDVIPRIDPAATLILQKIRPSFEERHLEGYLVKFINELEKSDMFQTFAGHSRAGVVHGNAL
jgi:HD-like signal output (HDOD) protein